MRIGYTGIKNIEQAQQINDKNRRGENHERRNPSRLLSVEICSKCHPFYTGQQKANRADGRIDKFNKKYGINK